MTKGDEREGANMAETQDTADTTQSSTAAPTAGIDDTELAKQWSVFFGGLFAAIGAGIGVFFILVDAVDMPIYDTGGSGVAYTVLTSAGGFVTLPPLLVVVATGFLGVFLAWQLDVDDATVYKTTAAAGVTAAVLSLLLAVVLGNNPAPSSTPDLDYVALVVTGILAGLCAAIAGTVGAYLTRNQTPDDLDVDGTGGL